jgi:hypothetical protein
MPLRARPAPPAWGPSLLIRGGRGTSWRKCGAVWIRADATHELEARGSTLLMRRSFAQAVVTTLEGAFVVRRRLVAHADTIIDAPVAEVWDAFINPRTIKQYMFGT